MEIKHESEFFKVPEQYRAGKQPIPIYCSKEGDRHGFFIIPDEKIKDRYLQVYASDGSSTNWEHVSVVGVYKRNNYTPSWEEMCKVKDLFWTSDATVIQYHSPKTEYINMHPNCLHLWRKIGVKIDLPPTILIGLKSKTNG